MKNVEPLKLKVCSLSKENFESNVLGKQNELLVLTSNEKNVKPLKLKFCSLSENIFKVMFSGNRTKHYLFPK